MRPHAIPAALLIPALLSTTLPARIARADEPSSAPTAPASAPPDVVRLKNGGMVRGTIEEMIPNDRVTIVLPSGARRTFEMKDVEYAGSADKEPKPTAKMPQPQVPTPVEPPSSAIGAAVIERRATIELKSKAPGAVFYVRTERSMTDQSYAKFMRLCTAPCSATLPYGTLQFAVAYGDELPREVDEKLNIGGPATVETSHDSRARLRLAGGVTILAGLALVPAAVLLGKKDQTDCKTTLTHDFQPVEACTTTRVKDPVKLGIGIGIGAAAILVGAIMASTPDKTHIRVVPAAPAPVPPVEQVRTVLMPSPEPARVSARDGLGLTLEATF